MKNVFLSFALMITAALLFSSCLKERPCKCDGDHATVKVFATGLNNPRGLEHGPDGYVYVAEGGVGGTNSTIGQCLQVPPPIGPFRGSPTGGRISRISPSGERTTLTNNFPTAVNGLGDVVGVADVAFIGNMLYALITGGGCSHGVPSVPNQIARVNMNGSHTMVANLSEFVMANPVENPEPGDFEPDGDWYGLISANSNLYAVEANHGQLVRITPGGSISRVSDISSSLGHIVPTVALYHDGKFLVGNLSTFPVVDGSANIYSITLDGQVQTYLTGFTTILGIAMDKDERLYVLQTSAGSPFPAPGQGSVVRIDRNGNRETIVSGLSFPTGMTYGRDGNLYVSNIGFGPMSIGGGQVLQIKLKDCCCDKANGYFHLKG